MNRNNDYYKYSKPIETTSGIKARTMRGQSCGKNWWSKRWISEIEKYIDNNRLARGKRYARNGQVVDIEILEGMVTAVVQGARDTPYQIRLSFKMLDENAREFFLFKCRDNASLAAKLLSNEIPEGLEYVFEEAGTPLFPSKNEIKRFKCTCPDDTVPCKHIIAVLFLIAEVIDEDPFLLFKLRGIDESLFMTVLTEEKTESDGNYSISAENCGYDGDECEISGGSDFIINSNEEMQKDFDEEDEEDCENWFKSGNFTFEEPQSNTTRRATALEVMTDFPFWRGEHPFRVSLAPIYEQAAITASEIITGEKKKPIGRPKKLL